MTEEKTTEEKALATQYNHESLMLARESMKDNVSIFLNVVKFEHCQRVANMLSTSTMVPAQFRENIGNCMIALNYADRLGVDVFMLMQSMYVVSGRPGIEGKMVIALINKSGLFTGQLQWKFAGTKNEDDWTCTAFAILKETEEVLEQDISWSTVKSFGWLDKKGPDKTVNSNMWRAMPEQMFKYRTASWFANSYCPEVKMGLYTVEELREIDAVPMTKTPAGDYIQAEVSDKLPEDLYKANAEVEKKPQETESESNGMVIGDEAVDRHKLNEAGMGGNSAESLPTTSTILWNPLKEPIQQKYGGAKRSILNKLGIERRLDMDGKLPREVHEMLLKVPESAENETNGTDQGEDTEKGEIVTPMAEAETTDQEYHLCMEMINSEIEMNPNLVDMARVNARLKTTNPEALEDAKALKAAIIEIKEQDEKY